MSVSNHISNPPRAESRKKYAEFLRRNGIIMAASVLVGGCIVWWLVSTARAPKQTTLKPQELSMVRVALPPPPTPPPRLKEPELPKPEQAQQMIAQEPVAADEPKEKPAEPKQEPEEAASMGTNIKGDGPDAFGLVGRGNGSIVGGNGTGNGNGGRGSSRWGWYAAQVQSTVATALGKNPKTRTTVLDISVRIWPNAAGRIERAQIVTSSGDPEIDKTIQNEVLAGLTLREPPPTDMPTPIVLRVSGHRP
ncbi:MAG: TonB C-terminal domain-containing protein [Chthoniobacteraceae bacterium]|nr:TonB C-terminal domain-containing protein [Chthoniobacteraceae bacterium]